MHYICNFKKFLEKLIGSTSGNDQLNAYWTNPPEDKNINSGQNLKNNSIKQLKCNRKWADSGGSILGQRKWQRMFRFLQFLAEGRPSPLPAMLSQLILWYKTRRLSELRNHKVEFGATTAARKCRTTLRKESWKEKVQVLCINSSVDFWILEIQCGLQEVQLRIKNGSEIKLPLRSQSLLLKSNQ